jgi:hypothetical protein
MSTFQLRDTFQAEMPESKFPTEAHKVLLMSCVPNSWVDKTTGEQIDAHELTVQFSDGVVMTFQKKGLDHMVPAKGVRPGTTANIVFVDARADKEIDKIFISVKSIVPPAEAPW